MAPMTIPQLAKQLGVSRITVYNRVKGRQIPATRVGRNYIISGKTVSRLLMDKITPKHKHWLREAVKTIVSEYGPLLKQLSKE